jgi:hypothetical protein
MAEIKTHLDEAINIVRSFFKQDSEIYVDVVQQILDYYKVPKFNQTFCSITIDDFFRYALNAGSPPIKNVDSLIYQSDQTLCDNIASWGVTIRKKPKAYTSFENVKLSDINDSDLRNNLIQRIIEENLDRLDQVYYQKEREFYYHINKSLLNAEYLFIENYSKKLNNTIELIERTEEISYEKIKKPRFIRDFIILASKLVDLCGRIRNAIGRRNNRRIEIEDHTEEKANRIAFYLNINDKPTMYSDAFLHFTQSVIEMTCIDHIYKASSDNIGKLLTLWGRIKFVSIIENDDFSTVVNIVKAKTAVLIYKMVFANGDDKSHNYLEIDSFDFFFIDSEKIKKEIEKERMPQYLNKIITYKDNNKEKSIDRDQLDNIISRLDLSICQNIQDIVKYDNWVERGQNHYIQMSSTIETIENFQEKDTNKVIDKIDEFIKEFIKNKKSEDGQTRDDIGCFSPFFFVSTIHFVNNQLSIKKDSIDDRNKLLELMYKLLLYLEHYIRTYTNSMPTVFRPYFEHSFYLYDKNNKSFSCFELESAKLSNYNCDDYKNAFFFGSYYCNAISIGRLHDFYERNLLQFQSFSSEMTLYLTQKETELETTTETIKTQQSEITKETKTIKDQQVEIQNQQKSINNHQHNSIQILGLFTAFLSFIVTTVATFRVVNNLSEYIIYSLTYTLAIILFAFLVSDHTTKNEKISKDKEPSWLIRQLCNYGKYIAYCVTIVSLLVFSIFYFTKSKPQVGNDKENNNNGVTITIDNSSTPNPNLDFSLSSKEGDTITDANKER